MADEVGYSKTEILRGGDYFSSDVMDIRFKQQHAFLDIRNVELGFNITKDAEAANCSSKLVNVNDLFLVREIRYNNNNIKAKSGRTYENLFHNWRQYSIGKK